MPSATPGLTLTGLTDDRLGIGLAGAGDVNGDGYADWLVGAPGDYTDGRGHAYLFLGGATVSATPAMTLTGSTSGDNLGAAVAGAGDVNGDGYADVLIGASGVDVHVYSGAGAVYLHLGSASGLGATPAMTIYGVDQ